MKNESQIWLLLISGTIVKAYNVCYCVMSNHWSRSGNHTHPVWFVAISSLVPGWDNSGTRPLMRGPQIRVRWTLLWMTAIRDSSSVTSYSAWSILANSWFPCHCSLVHSISCSRCACHETIAFYLWRTCMYIEGDRSSKVLSLSFFKKACCFVDVHGQFVYSDDKHFWKEYSKLQARKKATVRRGKTDAVSDVIVTAHHANLEREGDLIAGRVVDPKGATGSLSTKSMPHVWMK